MKDVFKEKYLKYEPKITLGIFTLVWNRLIELGYKSFCDSTVEYRYDEFKGRYSYFRTTEDHPNVFNCYKNGNPYSKTTVEEILGYNPFIKETTTSKDWNNATEEELLEEAKRRYPIGCKIKLIGQNVGGDFANEVRFTKYKFFGNSKRKQLYVDCNLLLFDGAWAEIETIPEVETKIDVKEVIPEYVELLPGFDTKRTGEIFDTKQPTPAYTFWTKSWTWEYLLTAENHKHYFKTSTKEAFDAQNKDETKEVIPEYIECIKPQGCYFIPGIVYKVLDTECKSSCKIISNIKCIHYEANDSLFVSLIDSSYFKPSTKEAFDAQNKDEEKSQFIVGKWYKCKSYDYIIKYFGIKKGKTGDAILYSDLIYCDKSYKSCPEGDVGVGYTTNKYWYELTDLSEIQQYLPDGHIDKIVKPVDKQVSKEPTRLSFYVKYCDEFTEDLLKSLLEWSQKNTTLKDRSRDNSFKGLKKDGYFLFDNFGLSTPKSRLYKDRGGYGYGVDNNTQDCFNEYSIKEVKELIGYKEQKPIEKWNIGSYIVFLQNEILTRTGKVTKGKLYQIVAYSSVKYPYFYADNGSLINFASKDSDKYGLKWFATKSEAEEFAKTLVEPIKEENKQAVHCTTKEEWDFFISKEVSKSYAMSKEPFPFQKDSAITFNNSWDRVDYLKNNDYQILSFQEWCDLNGYKMEKEVKLSLKQVVHCKTQEEWDFVSEKINYKFATPFNLGVNDTINLSDEKCDHKLYYENHSKYQILSFQEWCDLNGYKMEKELKQVAGVWYKWVKHRNEKDGLKYVKSNYFSKNILHYIERINVDGTYVYNKSECAWDEELVEVSLSEIQQYLPKGHPDKNSSVKDTVILNESSIGKFISFKYGRGDKFYDKAFIIKENDYIYLLNNCYSNNDGHKDKSIYKYSLKYSNFYEVKTFCKEIKFLTTEEVPKPKMILSIDDEELPMVNISKTNSLKQLLNLE